MTNFCIITTVSVMEYGVYTGIRPYTIVKAYEEVCDRRLCLCVRLWVGRQSRSWCWQLGRKSGCKAEKQDKQDIAVKTVTLAKKLDLVFVSNLNFTR